jgi:hypothetical protein
MQTASHERPVFSPGDHIVLPQDFNATCGTIESIQTHADGTQWALCNNAFDIFGKLERRVNIPLAHAKPWPHAPRMLSFTEAVNC